MPVVSGANEGDKTVKRKHQSGPTPPPIDRHSFLGRAILNAYDALGEAKYHIDCKPTFKGSLCGDAVRGQIEVAESQLGTVIRGLVTEKK